MKHIILAFSLNFLFSACSQDVSENSHQPENNMDHTNCFKAGKGEGFIGNNCCEGLTRINACFEDSSGSKNEFGRSCICQYHLGACTPCGNGKCENKFGENKCSCPEDCEKGQAQQEIQKNIIHNYLEEFDPQLYYTGTVSGDTDFLNVSSRKDCILFEYNLGKASCHYESDSLKLEGNNIEIIEGEASDCIFFLSYYGKKGKICGLKNGKYNLKVGHLSKSVTITK